MTAEHSTVTSTPTEERSGPSRRAVVKGMAWSVPVIAAASGIAQAAASGPADTLVDLYTIARNPNELPDAVSFGGKDTFRGPRTLTFTITYGNSGPDPMPAGAQINVSLPFDDLWDEATISAAPGGGYTITEMPPTTATVPGSKPGYPDMQRKVLPYMVNQEIPSGSSFTVVYSVNLNDNVTAPSDFYQVRTSSNIFVAGLATDTVAANNTDYADEYVRYNPTASVDAYSVANLANETADGTDNGGSGGSSRVHYQGPRYLTFDATYGNNGPGVIPEGSKITFQLPFTAAWDEDTFETTKNPSNMDLTLEGREAIDLDVNGAFAYRWTYVLDEPLQKGQSFTLTFGVQLKDTDTAATGGRTSTRVRTNIIVIGADDTNTDNNGGTSGLMYVNGRI